MSYLISEQKEDRASRASDLVDVFESVKQNKDGSYQVISQWQANKSYRVEGNTCTCLDFQYRRVECKHVLAVKAFESRPVIPVRA